MNDLCFFLLAAEEGPRLAVLGVLLLAFAVLGYAGALVQVSRSLKHER